MDSRRKLDVHMTFRRQLRHLSGGGGGGGGGGVCQKITIHLSCQFNKTCKISK